MDYINLMEQFRQRAGMSTPITPRTEDLFVAPEKHSDFLKEEADELRTGIDLAQSDLEAITAVADALCDEMVFLCHAICDFGLHRLFPILFQEVNRSNSTKGDDNGVFFDVNRKLIKGERYQPPNLSQFFDGKAVMTVMVELEPSDHSPHDPDTGKYTRDIWGFAEALITALGESLPEGTKFRRASSARLYTIYEISNGGIGLISLMLPFCGRHHWGGGIFNVSLTANEISLSGLHGTHSQRSVIPKQQPQQQEEMKDTSHGCPLCHQPHPPEYNCAPQ